MKKTMLASLIVATTFSTNAANLEDLSISGFGSVGMGKSNNDIGYARYTAEKIDWEQETLAGLQFDFQINDKAKFVTQLVANSRYDYAPKIEMAYASYEFEAFTARAGKLRLPLFFYSDYIDLGYAYPMIRPSQETYEHIVLKSYTGADLLIPVEFEHSSLLLQPVVGMPPSMRMIQALAKSNWTKCSAFQLTGTTATSRCAALTLSPKPILNATKEIPTRPLANVLRC